MKPANLLLLRENLKNLKLPHILRHFAEQSRQASEEGLTYGDFLLELTDIELQARAENRNKRRLREARFPLAKTLNTFDFKAVPELNKRTILELAGCDYIKERRNIIFMGRSGTGKTHLATALGIEACLKNCKTRFTTGYALANELIEAYNDKELSRIIKRYSRYDLLILDELGYVPFSQKGAELLFQVMAERNERGSIIITSNLGFANWTKIFGDVTMTAALLDRLTHNAHIIECNWDSYRLRQSLRRKERSGP
jgi:DNA replication protein DnaC